jgi:hypothetical protein
MYCAAYGQTRDGQTRDGRADPARELPGKDASGRNISTLDDDVGVRQTLECHWRGFSGAAAMPLDFASWVAPRCDEASA